MIRLMTLCGTLTTLVLCAIPAHAAVRTSTLEYKQGDTVLEGYLAYDDAVAGKRPGVIVVHEWTGVGPYVKGRAEQLAALGYVALAADIYGKGVRPANTDEAAKVAAIYVNNRALLRERVRAALDVIRAYDLVDPNRVAAIGYCFGGTTVLELARSGADLAGVVSFHGVLANPNPADARNIRCKVLAMTGANDPFVPPERVDAFEQEMRQTSVDWQLIVYGNAVHSFTNPASGNDPTRGVAYNQKADRRSWQAMRQFFDEIFRAPAR